VNFRSSAAKPGSNPASALICSVTSVPYLETGLRRPHHQGVDKLRSRALALSIGTACPKVPKTWQFPYPPLSLSREEKKAIGKNKKLGDLWTIECYELCFLILFCQDLSLGICGLDDKCRAPRILEL